MLCRSTEPYGAYLFPIFPSSLNKICPRMRSLMGQCCREATNCYCKAACERCLFSLLRSVKSFPVGCRKAIFSSSAALEQLLLTREFREISENSEAFYKCTFLVFKN
jgi:hypothetical protein